MAMAANSHQLSAGPSALGAYPSVQHPAAHPATVPGSMPMRPGVTQAALGARQMIAGVHAANPGGHSALNALVAQRGAASLQRGGAPVTASGAAAQMLATRGKLLPVYSNAEDAAAAGPQARVQAEPQESRGSFDACNALLRGVPAMDILVRYERSWSIQDALDQHAALAEQREVLAEIGRNRLRVRQTQLQFAELEVEEALDTAKGMGAMDASDQQRVLNMAGRLRAAVRDLRLAVRLRQMEQGIVDQQISLADAEIEKSRQEMTSMKEVIDDKSLTVATDETSPPPKVPVDTEGNPLKQRYNYCTNCKVGGHGQRFCEYFLERPTWRVYPHQKWFEDEKSNEYHCPLGKKLVDFADESHFSRIAMYLKGRAWLEEKTKVIELAPGLMPETYIIKNGEWQGSPPPSDEKVSNLPWFVKEADRNWGTSVHVCHKPSECMALAKSDATYVVQQHIQDPLLMEDGRKCHIKFYVFLMCLEDGVRWHLYTYKDGYLSISPNRWSPEDISKETQVTIIRSERIAGWKAWVEAYPKCKAAVGKVVSKAVTEGKLEGRLSKKQFEILSADFIVDTHGGVWLFEFNMSPVLKDPRDAPKVNDADMIRGALHIVSPCEGGSPGLWDFEGEYKGHPPQPKAPLSSAPDEDTKEQPASTAAEPPVVASVGP
mmetsp:Transcript_23659/g.43295  ORF Transcript_23659/g.43295 Transcript_23659/m.43295 type:complete len:661 (-) Transcript_23659:303-2285(-)